MNRNILIAYILTFCKNSWFWLGVWIFYYLKFTNYAGIGIIETVLIISMTLTEIPTGAIADLFGKRKTLFLSFLLQGIGAFWMAFTPNFLGLVGSVFVMGIGGTFYSGTLEALVYDSLKQEGKQSGYDRIISIVSSISLIAPALCGAVGGLMYVYSPKLPFVANGMFYFVAMIAALMLIEPKIDTEQFSWKNYFFQTKQGFKQLFAHLNIRNQTFLLLSIGVIVVIMDEMLNSFLGYEFGFSEEAIGAFWAVVYVIAALAAQLSPWFGRKWGEQKSLLLVGGLIALTLIVSPILGLILGGLSLLIRSSLQSIYGNLASIAINNQTESRYRATTLSTFNMLKNIPYVLTAYMFGSFADKYTAKGSALVLGLILMVLLIIQMTQDPLRLNFATRKK